MTDLETQVQSILLAVFLVTASFSTMGVGVVSSASTGNTTTFHVEQGTNCYDITALGDGTQSVEEFYDYRNNETNPTGRYSSYGTIDLQENQNSSLFVYNGSNGYSLVFLHDKFEEDGSGSPYASTITFHMSGMSDGEWAVRDDTYGNDTQDDDWNTSGDTHHIDWMWAENRNDGGAFRGIADDNITIEPDFNEDAQYWNSWPYSGDSNNVTEAWNLLSGDRSSPDAQKLAMDESVTIAAGSCSPETTTTTTTTTTETSTSTTETETTTTTEEPTSTTTTETTTTTSTSTSTTTTETTTTETTSTTTETTSTSTTTEEPTSTTTKKTTTEEPTSTTTTKKTTTTTEEPPTDERPTAALTAPDKVDLSHKFKLDASASSDDDKIVEYQWDFNNDGEVERKTSKSTVWLRPWKFYKEAGTYEATVTVVDSAGQTDSKTITVKVTKNDHTKPTGDIDAPETVEVGQEFTVTATNLSDSEDQLAHLCWTYFYGTEDGKHEHGPEKNPAKFTFQETGQVTIQLMLRDRAGNMNPVRTTVQVVANSDSHNGDDGDNSHNPVDPDPNEGSNGGYVPPANPSDSESSDNPDSKALDSDSITAETNDGLGTAAVTANGADDLEVTANATVPDGVRAPTPESNGIEPLSYLGVSGAETVENVTFTVPTQRLNGTDASADDVGLFRFADGSWSVVETEHVETTNGTHRFRANASQSGTFAVGTGEPAFAVTDLSVAQSRIDVGNAATVVATVENVGVEEGTYEATLTVGGDVVATKEVTVPAGETREVTFEPVLEDSGVFPASVGDANADLTVEGIETTSVESTADTATTGPDSGDESNGGSSSGVPGFGPAVALVALALAALVAARKQ